MDLSTTAPQNQNSKYIFEIPVITLTSRGGLGTFLSTFKNRLFSVGESAQLGLVRSWPRNPSICLVCSTTCEASKWEKSQATRNHQHHISIRCNAGWYAYASYKVMQDSAEADRSSSYPRKTRLQLAATRLRFEERIRTRSTSSAGCINERLDLRRS